MIKARLWSAVKCWCGRQEASPVPDRTLSELMAERGLDASGRRLERMPSAPQQSRVICTVEFSHDRSDGAPGHAVLRVTHLDSKAFHGFPPQDGEMQRFAWSSVRGLMKLVDTGEMLEPRELIDRYC